MTRPAGDRSADHRATRHPARLLNDRAAVAQSSAIRDLLEQAKRPGMISLAGGLPDASRFPTTQLAELAAELIARRGGDVLQYGLTQGEEGVRQSLATLFAPLADADRLVVTTGSQQALDLIARVVVNPGDHVIVGDPDYLGALQVLRSHGAELLPVAVDADGLDVDSLAALLDAGVRPRLCYLVPNFHNPTGASMTAERRRRLDELADRYGFLIVEDDPYRELYYDVAAPVHVPQSELTVRLRSTSKTLAPGLRVGVLEGPDWLTEAVVKAKQSVDLHTSTLSQAIVAEAVQAPWYDAHLRGLRTAYGAKRDALCAALRSEFGDDASFVPPGGGMFVWVRFEHATADAAAWLARCLDQGVCFVPGSSFAVRRDLSACVRLSFATGSADDLREGVRRMAAAR